MGAKGGNKKGANTTPHRGSMTLRQQAALEKQSNGKNISVSSETMLKLDHLKNIASWAATEARIPQLAAFYGQRYAATTEAAGVPPDPSLFYCERCESILEPGTNCMVRIKPNKSRRRRKRKNPNNPPPQNYVVYTCKVCCHHNTMRGTPKGYVKEMCGSKVEVQRTSKSNPSSESAESSKVEVQRTSKSNPSSESADIIINNSIDAGTSILEDTNAIANIDPPIVNGESGEREPNKPLTPLPGECEPNKPLTTPLPGECEPNKPLTIPLPGEREPNKPLTPPLTGTTLTLLESKSWRRRSGAKKTAKRQAPSSEVNGEKSAASSSKRRRKYGMSLKEIAEINTRQHGVGLKFDNISIPFDL